MKPQKILFFTLSYLIAYLGITYLIDYFFELKTNVIEVFLIGLFFSILLIVLLVFDVPEKIINKLIRKQKKDKELDENLIEQEEMVDDFFEKEKILEVNDGKEVNDEFVD